MKTSRIASAFVALCAAVLLFVPSALATPPSNVGQDEFFVVCQFAKNGTFDPIVFPGQNPAGHEHSFFGSTSIDQNSTGASLAATAGSTCRETDDRSGYWAPRPALDGVPFNPLHVSAYYVNWPKPSTGDSPAVTAFPAGTTMIAGNKNATVAEPTWKVRYSCGNANGVTSPASNIPYDCNPGQPTSKGDFSAAKGFDGEIVSVFFPACWNGQTPVTNQGTSPSVVYYDAGTGLCPTGFGIKLVRLSERIHLGVFDVRDAAGGVRLSFSSGSYLTIHTDFMNGWIQTRLNSLVSTCLNAAGHQSCSSVQ